MRRIRTSLLLLLLVPVALLDLGAVGEVLQGALPAREPPPATDRDSHPRLVVLGFDGVDYHLLQEYFRRGELPNLKALADAGGLQPLLSEIPPESPVALASLLTGRGPGRSHIFDFVFRGDDNQPGNGMVDVLRARFLGRIPVRPPRVHSRLAIPTFTERVWRAGYPVVSLRQPLLFPAPERPGARMTTGLGTPDLAGSAGFYTIYSNLMGFEPGPTMFGGLRVPLQGAGDARSYDTALYGPQDPTLGPAEDGGNQRAVVPLRFVRAEQDGELGVRIELQGDRQFLRLHDRSHFFSVRFELDTLPPRHVPGVVRFEVRSLDPLEILADPVQIDPRDAWFPVTTPEGLGKELWHRDGPFETIGWQEQTFARNDRFQDDRYFLRDLLQDMERGQVTLLKELHRPQPGDGTPARLVFAWVTATDRACHEFWRYRDPGHPAHDPHAELAGQDPIGIVFRKMDDMVGRVRAALDPGDTLLICSDHGFLTWRWAVKVNQWLVDHGYLVLRRAADPKGLGPFYTFAPGPDVVDWSKTRAFALGLGQIYLNLEGRDATGIVPPSQKRTLMEEIRAKLLKLENPYLDESDRKAGIPARAVASVTFLDDVYDYGPEGPPRQAPDMQIGFARGYRISWQTALLGDMAPHGDVFARNTAPWSGDHCSTDRRLVPGVVLSNRAIPAAPSDRPYTVRDIAATAMAYFGLDLSPLGKASRPIPLAPLGRRR